MDIFIASNRQLPIRYYVQEAVWIRRGGSTKLPELTLPFFVEVEIQNHYNLQIITDYIFDFQKQYKQTEIQLFIKDTALLATMQEMLGHHKHRQHAIYILPLQLNL
ncbi:MULTISPECIES: hypothetical protein [Lysinibacillus]|jgi:hypothetical protein|uniref:Uncharacterized protein n=1 Tax=Lysinibacillus fusiformis TaxID=28031 RepID=A0A2I0V3Z6_9BACI|nr:MULTISPECIES: hypothetical protein [Lysinibacillus]KUF36727.1 hypothetical protein AK833_02145 [Lysinibacillus sp. F5]MEE3807291.1 hypothetical protein [Lysinibacillus fusiformis]PKU53029.1 hypothetical protein CRI88_01475 [Lysinibacillus fusiformis]WCH49021.1 hypothetical protein NV349_06455 [Lysinibacillus sp. OF-1]SCX94339.1 hypothetical protein SAMN02787078_00562 [Lysinibacillus sp. SG9]